MRIKARSKKIEDLKDYLVAEHERLSHEIEGLVIQGQQSSGYGNHMADDATATFEQENSVTLRTSMESRLSDVAAALSRMDHGTYGLCQVCGESVDPARLKVLPSAGLCYKCQSRAEDRM